MKRNYHPFAQSTVILLIFVWVMLLLNSCSTSSHAPTKTPDNYVKGGSKNCGWAYN